MLRFVRDGDRYLRHRVDRAWHSLCRVQLPEEDPAATRAKVHRRHPTAVEAEPNAEVRCAIDGIVALLSGEKM